MASTSRSGLDNLGHAASVAGIGTYATYIVVRSVRALGPSLIKSTGYISCSFYVMRYTVDSEFIAKLGLCRIENSHVLY